MKVNWIELTNIKSYKTTTKVKLNPDYNFVVGTNGSGKTTLLQALSSCLLLLVPPRKTESEVQGTVKKIKFSIQQQSINLPRNFELGSDPQKISIEVSFEPSKDGLISEIESYIEIFQNNSEYIQSNYWGQEDLVQNSQTYLNAFKSYSNYTFMFDFDVNENTVSISDTSRQGNQGILNVLEHIETQRVIYDQLYRQGKTDKAIDKGFHLIYLGSDRIAGFPAEISLGKGNVDEFLNNTAYSRNADLFNNIYSTGSFDYINQTLTRISEKFLYRRWRLREEKPLDNIPEYKEICGLVKDLLDLEFIVETPEGSPFETMKFFFKSGNNIIPFEQMSSGEKSLIYYLFTLANPDIRNSFVIFDEAEIHLHGNMQDILLEILFSKKNLDNQHFISTHSPKLINRLTISSVLRFYKVDRATQYITFRSDSGLGSDYDVIKLINGQNNEKIFFADKVVLVEGIKDRILLEAILRKVNDTKEIIEVIDVGGKHNLTFYREYLNNIKVKNYILADFDYLYDLKKSELRDLFVTDSKRIDSIIKSKTSEDRKSLIESIESFVNQNDKQRLEKTIQYLKSRGVTLKSSLSKEDIGKLTTALEVLKTDSTYIISQGVMVDPTIFTGEIEDYLRHIAAGKNNQDAINTLVGYVGNDKFLEDLVSKCNKQVVEELLRFVAKVVFDDESKAVSIAKTT